MIKKQKEFVLFLCYYFPPMGMGGTQRVAKFAKYLPQYGWEPIVITVKDVHYYAHDHSLLNDLQNIIIFRTESFDPLRLLVRFKNIRKEMNSTSDSGSNKNLLNFLNETIGSFLFIPDSKILWLPFALLKSFQLIRSHKIKVIFTSSPPHSAHLGGLVLKLFFRVKWIADFRDDWTGGESQPCPTRFHIMINRLQEKLVLKYADRVVGMCDHLTNSLQRKSGSRQNKFRTIMNGYDAQDFMPVLATQLNSSFTITHCGSISRVSDPEPFLKAVRFVFDEHEELVKKINIQFVGTDIYGRLDYLLKKYKLQNVIPPIQYLPHDQALKKLMVSHLLLITIFKKTTEEIITGKIFEYFGSGKPILLISQGGFIADTIKTLNRGTVIANNDIQGIKNAILHYYELYAKDNYRFYTPLSVPEFDRRQLTLQLAREFLELLVPR